MIDILTTSKRIRDLRWPIEDMPHFILSRDKAKFNSIYLIHFQITGGPCNLIGSIYSQIAPFFALNHIIFPANEEVTLQTCGLTRRFRERLRYTVELSSNQK